MKFINTMANIAVQSFMDAARIVMQLFWWMGVGTVVAARRIGFDLQRRGLEAREDATTKIEGVTCSVCGASNESSHEFCFVCGQRL